MKSVGKTPSNKKRERERREAVLAALRAAHQQEPKPDVPARVRGKSKNRK